jgi:hypothetical protein
MSIRSEKKKSGDTRIARALTTKIKTTTSAIA